MNTKWMAAVMSVVIAFAVGACASGDASEDPGVATADGGDVGGPGGSVDHAGGVSDQEFQDAIVAYTECMREQGIDMPDPETDGGMVEVDPGDMDGAESEEFKAADEACKEHLPDMGEKISPEDQAQAQDAMLEFVDCMRDQGIQLPEPENGEMSIPLDGDGLDPEDPDFKAAEDQCRSILEEGMDR